MCIALTGKGGRSELSALGAQVGASVLFRQIILWNRLSDLEKSFGVQPWSSLASWY